MDLDCASCHIALKIVVILGFFCNSVGHDNGVPCELSSCKVFAKLIQYSLAVRFLICLILKDKFFYQNNFFWGNYKCIMS